MSHFTSQSLDPARLNGAVAGLAARDASSAEVHLNTVYFGYWFSHWRA
jgi:hypothetical protein